MDDEHRGINGYSYQSTACYSCHPRGNEDGAFNHSNTDFPLLGKHIEPECSDCHTSNITPSMECVSCHEASYNETKQPNHAVIGLEKVCENCHDSFDWQPSSFIHSSTGYDLPGKHSTLACAECHTSANVNLSQDCVECHREEFNTAPNHLSQSFPTDCNMCHNSNLWIETNFNHTATEFPLIGIHSTTECSSCHENGFAGTTQLCVDCHKIQYDQSTNPNHSVIGLETNCENCHDSYAWSPSSYDHATTGFSLLGKHGTILCTDCHTSSTSVLTQNCYDCHTDNFNNAANHLSQNYPKECEMCHNSNTWLETDFNHSSTQFPLLGVHETTDCSSCHATGFTGTSQVCSDCHKTDYDLTMVPNHAAIGLGTNCENCHDSYAWSPSSYDHATTGFSLLGKHGTIQCTDCHTSSTSTLTQNCYDCHTDNFNNAADHLSQNYPKECEMCHNSNTWLETDFNHSSTQFPLLGVHETTDCSSCHVTGYTGTSQVCSDCHKNAYDQSTNPNHQEIGLTLSCENCHDSKGWSPSSFNHESTGFVLIGKHNLINCNLCHTSSAVKPAQDCFSCHTANYNDAPDHLSQSYPTDCAICHNSTDWKQTNFNHSSTQFPLLGVHETTDCSSCHVTGYTGTSQICSDCHKNAYDQSTNPNHSEIGLTLSCANCHDSKGWTPSSFNHESTGFVLAGKHNLINCNLCHTSSAVKPAQDCFSCHTANYNNAPDHLSQSYPTDCAMCHNSTDWKQTDFNHSTTDFPLTGAHITTACADCHKDGYTSTSTACNSCHSQDYTSTANPNHVSLGLSVTCNDCHTTSPGWSPATFAIHNTYYVLQGAHAVIKDNCTVCHSNDYNNTPNTCYGCHQSDYNNTTNPTHSSSGFSTGCEDCHSQSAWKPSTFDHDNQYFPIYSGEHRGEWDACSDCHEEQSDFSIFTCISCHEHNKTEMDDEHRGINNYQYVSTACYDCHPTGNDDGLLIIKDHVHSVFRLFGAHKELACSECHTDPNEPTAVKCINCHEHSGTRNASIHTNVKGFINKNFACLECHETGKAVKVLEEKK
jgi:hypothetical protein